MTCLDVELTHVGELCSFDAFLQRYQLTDPALTQLAVIVRGADTGRPELAPQAAGLLAVSLGPSAIFADDHELLQHGMVIYDCALYAWRRSWPGRGASAAAEYGGLNRRRPLSTLAAEKTMIRTMRLLVAAALTIGISVPADAEENFELLKAKQIRARVVGKDISNDVHWSEYYRKDGALISMDMGTKQIGTGKSRGISSVGPSQPTHHAIGSPSLSSLRQSDVAGLGDAEV